MNQQAIDPPSHLNQVLDADDIDFPRKLALRFACIDVRHRCGVHDDIRPKTCDEAFDIPLVRDVELSIIEKMAVEHEEPMMRRVEHFILSFVPQQSTPVVDRGVHYCRK